jgi:GntR family transcriptional repressor for pyruvate dehydrogenase complex
LLQQSILDGTLQSGQCLPSQRELSEQFGISRASLREALSMLETLGLVSVQPGRGVFVTTADARAPLWHFAERGSAHDVYEARLALEVSAASLAARRIDATGLTKLEASVGELRTAYEKTDLVGMVSADAAFHDALVDISGNPLIVAMYRAVRELMVASQRLPLARRIKLSDTVAEHEVILACLARHDPAAAAKAMQAHITGAAARYGIALNKAP